MLDYENGVIKTAVPLNFDVELIPEKRYLLRVYMSDNNYLPGDFVWPKRADADSETTVAVETDAHSDSASDTDSGTGTNTAADTGTETDTATDTDTDSSTHTDSETETKSIPDTTDDSAADTDSATETDTPSETAPDTDWPNPLHIEAECAVGASMGDCDGAFTGDRNPLLWDEILEKELPECNADCTLIEYMNTGAGIRFDGIDFTSYTGMRIHVASNNEVGNLQFVLNYGEADELILYEILDIYTEGWRAFETQTITFNAVPGVHALTIIGGENADDGGNANIDWFELFY